MDKEVPGFRAEQAGGGFGRRGCERVPDGLWQCGRAVAASTQNQAFNALLFFYRHVLGGEFGKLEGVARAKRRRYVPVVLSRAEVEAVLSELEPRERLVALLLNGCGLRPSECLGLRVQYSNLDAMLLTVLDK